MSALLVFSGLNLAHSTPAVAAEPALVAGTVFADANKNNSLDFTGKAGEIDRGVEEIAVTLSCVSPVESVHPGWTTQTNEAGKWSFPASTDWASRCTNDQLRVSLNTKNAAGDAYAVHAVSSSDNAFASIGAANQQARTKAFSAKEAPVELDALIWPTWKLSLELPNVTGGLDGKAVFTGSEPWDQQAGDGYDQTASDSLVRSGDVTKFTWSVTASAEEALADAFSAAVLEQTILLGDGAVANFAGIPATCSGTAPANEIRAFAGAADTVGTPIAARTTPPAGTTHLALSCNIGEVGISTSAILLDTSIWASPNSANGSEFTSTARVYGVTSNGVATAQPEGPVTVGPIKITSMPRYDLAKHAPFSSAWAFQTINGERIAGRQFYYPVTISTDRQEGTEAFQQPVTFTEDFWAQGDGENGTGTGLLDNFEYHLIDCAPSRRRPRRPQLSAARSPMLLPQT